jgi:hypothetical protein
MQGLQVMPAGPDNLYDKLHYAAMAGPDAYGFSPRLSPARAAKKTGPEGPDGGCKDHMPV